MTHPDYAVLAGIQECELAALALIYEDDFVRENGPDDCPAFHVKLHPSCIPPVAEPSVTLQFQYTKDYPFAPPLFTLRSSASISRVPVKIHEKAKEGVECAFELMQFISELLGLIVMGRKEEEAPLEEGDVETKLTETSVWEEMDKRQKVLEEKRQWDAVGAGSNAEQQREAERLQTFLSLKKLHEEVMGTLDIERQRRVELVSSAPVESELDTDDEHGSCSDVDDDGDLTQSSLTTPHTPASVNNRAALPVTPSPILKRPQHMTVSTVKSPTAMPLNALHSPRWGEITCQKAQSIGRGRFGTVYIGLRSTGELIAVKEVQLNGSPDERYAQLRELETEITAMKKLKHRNIVQYLGCEQNFNEIRIFMEFVAGGSLQQIIANSGALGERVARRYTKQLLTGLKYLHDNRVLHRDIKSGNVLVDQMGVVKLADFGYAQFFEKLVKDGKDESTSKGDFTIPQAVASGQRIKGTPAFMAPEVAQQRGYGRRSDIWSLGCIVLHMLTGRLPYDGLDIEQLFFQVVMGKPPQIPSNLSTNARSFLVNCFESNAKHRPFTDALLSHPWIAEEDEDDLIDQPIGVMSAPKPSKDAEVQCDDDDHEKLQIVGQDTRYGTEFEEYEIVGRGGFGVVVRARHILDQRYYAIKKIKLDVDVNVREKVLREVMTLARLHHPFIVRYMACWIQRLAGKVLESGSEDEEEDDEEYHHQSISQLPPSSTGDDDDDLDDDDSVNDVMRDLLFGRKDDEWDQDEQHDDDEETDKEQYLFIQMEFCDKKTLRTVIDERLHMKDSDNVDMREVWRLFRQILEGLAYVHSQGIIHRDMKPGNVFLDSDNNVKIGDFGLAVGNGHDIPDDDDVKQTPASHDDDDSAHLTLGVGTHHYIAPEQFNKGAHYDLKADLFACGVILFEMVQLFNTETERREVLQQLRENGRVSESFARAYPTAAKVINCLICHDPEKRPTASELLQGDILPPKEEDEFIKETNKIIQNPTSTVYNRLIESLHYTPNMRHEDYLYDEFLINKMESKSQQVKSRLRSTITQNLTSKLTRLLDRSSGVALDIPLLRVRRVDEPATAAASLIDTGGVKVTLPSDGVTSFARYLGRAAPGHEFLRYNFGHMYRRSGVGHPDQIRTLDIDYVGGAGPTVSDLSVIPQWYKALPVLIEDNDDERISYRWDTVNQSILAHAAKWSTITKTDQIRDAEDQVIDTHHTYDYCVYNDSTMLSYGVDREAFESHYTPSPLQEAMVIRHLHDVLRCCLGTTEHWIFRVSHRVIVDAILHGIPTEIRSKVHHILSGIQHEGFSSVKRKLKRIPAVVDTANVMNYIEKFMVTPYKPHEVHAVVKSLFETFVVDRLTKDDALNRLTRNPSEYIKSRSIDIRLICNAIIAIRRLFTLLCDLGISGDQIVLDLSMADGSPTSGDDVIYDGLVFQCVVTEGGKLVTPSMEHSRRIVAYGGRYDRLIRRYQLPDTSSSGPLKPLDLVCNYDLNTDLGLPNDTGVEQEWMKRLPRIRACGCTILIGRIEKILEEFFWSMRVQVVKLRGITEDDDDVVSYIWSNILEPPKYNPDSYAQPSQAQAPISELFGLSLVDGSDHPEVMICGPGYFRERLRVARCLLDVGVGCIIQHSPTGVQDFARWFERSSAEVLVALQRKLLRDHDASAPTRSLVFIKSKAARKPRPPVACTELPMFIVKLLDKVLLASPASSNPILPGWRAPEPGPLMGGEVDKLFTVEHDDDEAELDKRKKKQKNKGKRSTAEDIRL